MYKWVQKEMFFVATLAFVFVATASVSSFLKNHLHHEATLASTARVFWPDNQEAVYPKTPPESFFIAQKEKAKESALPTTSNEIPTMAHSKIQNVVSGTYRSLSRSLSNTPKRSRPKTIARTYRKASTTRVIKRTGAATSTPQKARTQKPNRKKTEPGKVDTLAIRAHDVHMKWVKKTLAEYQDSHP